MKKTISILSLALAAALTASAIPGVRKATATPPLHAARVAQSVETKSFEPEKVRTMASADGIASVASKARLAAPQRLFAPAVSLPQIYGVVVWANNWGYNPKTGLYSIPSASDNFEMKIDGPNGSSVVVGDRVYTINHVYLPDFDINYPRYTIYDFDSGEELHYYNLNGSNIDWSILPVDMDVDPITGDVYAITYNSDMSGCQLSVMEFTDTDVYSTKIADLEGNWNSMAIAADGTIYGISKTYERQGNSLVCTGSTLSKIDRTTGAVTPVGATGVAPEYATSAAIDRESGRMFWTVSPADESGYLAEIDLATGAATMLRTFAHAEEVVGLYVPERLAADAAPAVPTGLEAIFEGGNLSGKVKFTAPTTLYNGTAATGALTYEILANGNVVASGNTTFGAAVEADVTLASSGEYKIAAAVSNAAGRSPEARVSVFVGNGVPMAPYARLTYSGGAMNLVWTAVTETVDGGYIDPSLVTYTVRRYPDQMIVANATSATTYTEQIPVPDTYTAYYYGVTANYGDSSSEEFLSNRVALGELVPPFTETFDSEDAMTGWTIIDANGDHRMWMWSTLNNLRISFNSQNSMDDWVIAPAMHLEAGRAYRMSFEAYCDDASQAERIEVMLGTAPTAAAMTTTIVNPTLIQSLDPVTVSGVITPAESGTYYIGIHGISDADCYMLNLDNFKVEAGLDSGAPAAATNLVAVPDPSGAYKATISFRTPTLSIAGGAMWQSFKKVEVWRDGELVKLFTYADPGDELSFVDTPGAAGTYTYTVYCYNMFGQGMPAVVSVFVGIGTPAKPLSASIVETANEGEVTVSWTPVTTDEKGNAIDPSKITYTIGENTAKGWRALYTDLTAMSHTFRAVSGEQDFVQYAVFAETEGGVSEGTLTDLIPVGPAFAGLEESFPGGEVSSIWGRRTIQNGVFGLFDEESGIPAQDGDNGFIGMGGAAYGDCGALFSGKISLAGISNPCLSFYTFNLADDNINEIAVGVKVVGTDEFITLKTAVVNQVAATEEWGRVAVSLAAFEGRTIQIQFLCTIKAYAYILIDNIKVASMLDYDLAAQSISAPAQAKTGTEYTVAVTVANDGAKSAMAYTVDLFANGTKAETRQCATLASGAKNVVEFVRSMPAFDAETVEYYAVVNYSADAKTDNNRTSTVAVAPKTSKLPAPTGLSVASEGNGLKITWNAPDVSSMEPEEITESFEDGVSFANNFEGWTFVDIDNAPLGGFQSAEGANVPVPGMTTGTTTGSFFVFDGTYSAFTEGYAAHNGDKYLAALFRFDDGLTDDWAISPELSGAAQTLSFYARSFSSLYLEKIQILYSTGSTSTADFQPLCELTTVPAEWTPYSINLPAGAKRFALRSSSEGSFMLMVDDFTFTPAVSTANLTVAGYNVYRNGVKINNAPLVNPQYFDASGAADHMYVATAIYDGVGESGASNAASLNTGIEEISAEAGECRWYNLQGIEIDAPTAPGFYIRSQSGKNEKVRVQ